MRNRRILVLAGTREARDLAEALLEHGYDAVSSLAGVTRNPILPAGKVRLGGFGGVAGLVAFLKAEGFAAVVDATHPFAAQMSAQAHAACKESGVQLLRFERPAWKAIEGDDWTRVSSVAAAAAALPSGARAMVTIGRKEIAAFTSLTDVSGVARMIEAPALPLPDGWTVLLERPPFSVASEVCLFRDNCITHLVTKNAGGSATEAKLIAARHLRLPVVMVERPVKPDVPFFTDKRLLIQALQRVHSP